MKRYLLILLLLLLAADAFPQAQPKSRTKNFQLKQYAQGANPSADSLNWNWARIDSAIQYAMRSWIDTLRVYTGGPGRGLWIGKQGDTAFVRMYYDSVGIYVRRNIAAWFDTAAVRFPGGLVWGGGMTRTATPSWPKFTVKYGSASAQDSVRFLAGTNISFTLTGNNFTINASGGGGADPDSTLWAKKWWTANQYAPLSHTQAQSTITNLADTLGKYRTKADTVGLTGTPTINAMRDSLGDLRTTIDGKAATSHTQAISTVTVLQDSLTAKLNRGEATTLLGLKLPSSSYTKQSILDSLNGVSPDTINLTRIVKSSARMIPTSMVVATDAFSRRLANPATFNVVSSAGGLKLLRVGATTATDRVARAFVRMNSDTNNATGASIEGLNTNPGLCFYDPGSSVLWGGIDSLGNWYFGGTVAPAKIHAQSTTEQLRLGYDASNYTSFTTDASGYLTLAPTGKRIGINVAPASTVGLYHITDAQYGIYGVSTFATAATTSYGLNYTGKASGVHNSGVIGILGRGHWSSDSSSTASVVGVKGSVYLDKNVTVPNAFSFWAENPIKTTGTINLAVGLYLESITSGGANYSIYSAGGSGYHAGSWGVGVTPLAKLHSQATTEQFRLGYDASNYSSQTVSPTGLLTFGGAGTNGGAIAGNTLLRDTSAFTTTATRKAIYIAGATSTDQYQVTARHNADVLPAEHGDDLAYWAKTDSLIVTRAAGGTSGLKFGWLRVK